MSQSKFSCSQRLLPWCLLYLMFNDMAKASLFTLDAVGSFFFTLVAAGVKGIHKVILLKTNNLVTSGGSCQISSWYAKTIKGTDAPN